MTELQRKQQNADRLFELFPTFRIRLTNVIADLELMGMRPRIQDGYRSPEDQMIAFNSNHSK